MAVIDTLKLGDAGGVATPPTFTVNTAVTEVVANFPAAPNTYHGIFETAEGLSEFAPNDNLRILSMSLVLPFCFGLGSEIPYWGMLWRDTTGGDYVVAEWSSAGTQQPYATNVEIPLDIYVPFNPLMPAANNSQLAVGIARFTISMIGVPAALDGTDQDIQIVLKVLHNLDMT